MRFSIKLSNFNKKMATNKIQVLIIGAGMAGLAAANRLTARGIRHILLDKGRGIGGRMATRREEGATFDHGAQYFSAKTPNFQQFVKNAAAADTIREWRPKLPGNVHPRWVGSSGMNAVPKFLEENVTALSSQKAVRIEPARDGWRVYTEAGDAFEAISLLLTIPAPQALELLANSPVALPEADLAALRNITYHPCLALLATLDRPSGVPAPGGLSLPEGGILSWVADNFQKGISPKPSLTLHASAAFSQAHLDGDLQAAGKRMLDAAAEWVAPGAVHDWQIHRWRYSLAWRRHPAPFLRAQLSQDLLFGGDGFGSGNVEGAFLSGLAMADHL